MPALDDRKLAGGGGGAARPEAVLGG